MEPEFIREYASRIAKVFTDRAFNAKLHYETTDYVRDVEERRDFWKRVAQLPSDSEHWELVKGYMTLISDPKATKIQQRNLYKFLREKVR